MAFKSLADRFGELPLVLAGPILRQVTKDAVTVWVTLQQSATVTLTVYDSDQMLARTALMTAGLTTTAVGKNLHIVAVTARSKGKLSEGHIYFYDLTFVNVPRTWTLSQAVTPPGAAPVLNPFSYPPYALPSFALPPKDLTKLRLIHGSCRKPHGEGFDALAMLDGLIRQKATDPLARPHQLILSGDQIYADDVADTLLVMLTDAGEALLGWSEALPIGKSTQSATTLPPYVREKPLRDAGFTSDDLRSQLMSLGEYFAMYLFAWSDVLWPDKTTKLDTFAEILAISFPGLEPNGPYEGGGTGAGAPPLLTKTAKVMLSRRKIIESDTANVENYRSTLPAVRLAMANIPSYMICDDHEVTDDWNMTRRFCQDVYGGSLGVRVVQNALISFAVCQAWGNVPEQFADDPKNPPGLQLLQALEKLSVLPKDEVPAAYAASDNQTKLMNIVGVHTDDQLKKSEAIVGTYAVFHEGGASIPINGVQLNNKSLRYNFSIEGDGHQVIVTDTRTWRSFPEAGIDTHAEFLPTTAQSSQFELDVPPLGNRLLMVVFTTNIPPITSVRLVEGIGGKSLVYEHDLYDSWQFPSVIYDRLIVRLSQKVAKAGQPNDPVVFLSGDVHFAFSSRLAYWAEKAQLGDLQGQETKAKMVFAQLVASSLKNEIDDTRGMQDGGYTYHPSWWQKWVLPPHKAEGYVGWNTTQKQLIGSGKDRDADDVPLFVDGDHPTLSNSDYVPIYVSNTLNIKNPDYRYRLDFLTTAQSGQVAPTPPTISSISGATPGAVAQAHGVASKAYLSLIDSGAQKPDCIGHNNLGEIEFSWNAAKGIVDHVYHTLHWQVPDPHSTATPKSLLNFAAIYDISTDMDDQNYPPIKADTES